MARIPYLTIETAEGDAKAVLQQLTDHGQNIINVQKALANCPAAMRNFLRLGDSLLRHGKLPPALREILILRIAKLVNSQYEWEQHLPIARKACVREDQIEAIAAWEGSPAFSALERACLRYTDLVTTNKNVPDDVFDELRAHLDDSHIAELTLVSGFWGGLVAKFLLPLKIDIEGDGRLV